MKALEKLELWFEEHPKVLIAMSGGVDSTLLAYIGRKVNGKQHAVAVIGVSPSLKERDLTIARNFCATYDIRLEEIMPNEITNPSYVTNPVNRCYFCKTALYEGMQTLVVEKYAGYEIVNGNNATDLSDYRPGKKAAEENNIHSPLAACAITKLDIRSLARSLNLPVWDKPASPCLSSRVAYGEMITPEKLAKIERAENFLNDRGFSDVRVRFYSDKVSVEVPKGEIPSLMKLHELKEEMNRIGIKNWYIDKEGLVSGKLNKYAMITPTK